MTQVTVMMRVQVIVMIAAVTVPAAVMTLTAAVLVAAAQVLIQHQRYKSFCLLFFSVWFPYRSNLIGLLFLT